MGEPASPPPPKKQLSLRLGALIVEPDSPLRPPVTLGPTRSGPDPSSGGSFGVSPQLRLVRQAFKVKIVGAQPTGNQEAASDRATRSPTRPQRSSTVSAPRF